MIFYTFIKIFITCNIEVVVNHGCTFSIFLFCCVTSWYYGFRTYCLHLQVNPEKGGSMFLHSGTNLSDHIIVPQPKRSQYYQCCHANCKSCIVILSSLWLRGSGHGMLSKLYCMNFLCERILPDHRCLWHHDHLKYIHLSRLNFYTVPSWLMLPAFR